MYKLRGRNIEVTRGDMLPLTINTLNEDKTPYTFKVGEVIRFTIMKKKDVKTILLQKNFVVEQESQNVDIDLTSEDTKIGELIDEPEEYWYEIELNPDSLDTITIMGYTKDDGPALFWLLPEGGDKK